MSDERDVLQATTLSSMLRARCRATPDRLALADQQGEWTYRELGAAAQVVAARLHAAGAGGNIGVLVPGVKAFAAGYFGALLAGGTPVPLNFLLEVPELAYILEHAAMGTVVASRHFQERLAKLPLPVLYLEDTPEAATAPPPETEEDPDEVGTLLYTSGTTGHPKGVELTHRNLISNLEGCQRAVDVSSDDVLLCSLPMFHTFALTVNLLLPVRLGAQVHFLPRFSGRAALELMRQRRVTLFAGVPSMFGLLVRSAQRSGDRPEALRLPISGGAPLPQDLAQSFQSALGLPLLEGYGMTESSPVISLNSPRAHRPGTVGRPLDNLEVRIADDRGEPLPQGTDGEIWARGPSVMRGYRLDPEATAEALTPDGWLRTGDIGQLDADGFLRITGRKKEMIVSGGENIFPREIEEVLASHPAVAEAAVIGVPDRMRGEVPHAFVLLLEGASATAEELREYLRGRIADYKIPRGVEIHDDLPRSSTGKVLKRALTPRASAPD